MLDGNARVTDGTVQLTSPMSSEPPPRISSIFGGVGRVSDTALSRPCTFTFISSCSALANRWSSADHFGIPTCLMFACIATAIGLLWWIGQAEPNTRVGSRVVPVIMAAPRATESPMAQRVLILG